MRALPVDLSEYLGSTARGKTAFPTLPGDNHGAGEGAGAGAAAAIGAVVASDPHCALRKSFHFIPLRVPAALASLYFALHSCIESAWAVGAGTSAGAAAGAVAGAAVASAPHWLLRISFHFMPLSVPAFLAAWYFALHSCIESALAEVLCIATTLRSVTAYRAM